MQWISLFKHQQHPRIGAVFSENQSAPKLENRKTSPCSPRAPNLLHVLPSRMVGWNKLCNPEHTLNILWTYSEHTLNIPWRYAQDLTKSQKRKSMQWLSLIDPRDASASKITWRSPTTGFSCFSGRPLGSWSRGVPIMFSTSCMAMVIGAS